MSRKASLVLIEQLIMILVFALCAALCLGVFTGAYRISQEAEDLDAAVFLVQNAAEVLKSSGGNLSASAGILGGTMVGNSVTVSYESGVSVSASSQYVLYIQETEAPVPGLGQAEVYVVRADAPDTVLFSVRTTWQEVTQ